MESFRVGQLPASKDMSHHLSQLAKERRFSPLKSFAKYMVRSAVLLPSESKNPRT